MKLAEYIKNINKKYKRGNATELTFRSDLEQLLETLISKEIEVTNEPRRQECGSPDYILTKGTDIPVGFIETKYIGDTDLDGKNKNKEQFDRYKAALDNIIFTDYLRFHLYREGSFKTEVVIGKVTKKEIKPLHENFENFEAFIEEFKYPTGFDIKNPKQLAEIMAGKARLLFNVLEKAVSGDEDKEEDSTLKDQMISFKKILIPSITPKEFADVYAQTIVYGMFTARLHDTNLDTFSRQEAAELIPKSNPFLRKLFGYIAGPEIDDRIRWVVDDLTKIFLSCDVKKILQNYGGSTKTEEPIIYFYEDFLGKYDPQQRKNRGVYYTPVPVVSFIVRAVDEVLKTRFGLSQGLADTTKISIKDPDEEGKSNKVHRVQILDPATGTGTFLSEIIKHVYERFQQQQGIWNSYVENHLLPRLNGFELLMAPYAIAHLKIDLLLTSTGFTSTSDNRVKVYLTNSLEEQHSYMKLPFAEWLSEEVNEANRIKRDTPVLCVIGNPPYKGESINSGKWIMNLMNDYKKEPGGKNKLRDVSKWINNDYVKFLRYGQHFIEKNGSGILAFINPHSFLDGLTFRGMRWKLLTVYDTIYIIDLHGSTKRREATLDGKKDENIFDIQQGVSINIFIKTGKKETNTLAQVFHYDMYGLREKKYDFLQNNSLKDIAFKKLSCSEPNFFFAPKSFIDQELYDAGFQLTDLFLNRSVGIVTARDKFTLSDSKEKIKGRIEEFLSITDDEEAREYFNLGKDVKDWKVSEARTSCYYPDERHFTKIAYRPFDERWTYYTGEKGFLCAPRVQVMKHFVAGENLGLVCCRQFKGSENYSHVFVTQHICDSSLVSNRTSEVGSCFPLYSYIDREESQKPLPLPNQKIRKPNFDMNIVETISNKLSLHFVQEPEDTPDTFAPINLLDYIYAVLHSLSYRKKYEEFLRIGFPRIPYPQDQNSFRQLVELGRKLREIHLLKSSIVEEYITQYPVAGDDVVDIIRYEQDRVFINDTQYFTGVPEAAWNFCIGSYKPAQKWLKDRKGAKLTFDDLLHYQKIIVALAETNKIMKKIDLLIRDVYGINNK